MLEGMREALEDNDAVGIVSLLASVRPTNVMGASF